MVMAAHNQCKIKAKVINITRDSNYSDKRHLDMEILATESLEGPNFAQQRIGQTVKGYTFDLLIISKDMIIEALAEYIGDEFGGQFQLTQLNIIH